jgi:hypothetical protein
VNIRKDAKFAFFQKKWRVGNVFLDSLGKWTYKSPVFLGENQEFSIFWPKNRAFFPITTGTYKSISLDCWSSRRHHYAYFQVDFSYPCSIQ